MVLNVVDLANDPMVGFSTSEATVQKACCGVYGFSVTAHRKYVIQISSRDGAGGDVDDSSFKLRLK